MRICKLDLHPIPPPLPPSLSTLAGNISPHYPKLSPSMFAFDEYSNFLEPVSGFFCPSLFNWKLLSIVFLCFVYGLHKCSHFERSSSFVSCFYLSWSIFFCLQYVRYLFVFFCFFLSPFFFFSVNDVLVRFIHIFHPITLFSVNPGGFQWQLKLCACIFSFNY